MTLRKKHFIATLFGCSVQLILLGLTGSALLTVRETLQTSSQTGVAQVFAINRVSENFEQLRSEITNLSDDHVGHKDSAIGVGRVDEILQGADQSLATINPAVKQDRPLDTASEDGILRTIRYTVSDVRADLSQLLAEHRLTSGQIYILSARVNILQDLAKELRARVSERVSANFVTVAARFRYVLIISGGLFGAILLVMLIVATVVSHRAVKRMQRIGDRARQIGNGDLDAKLDVGTGDEIDQVAGAFNEMAAALRESLASVAHGAVHDALTGLPNRVLFMDRIDQRLERARREQAYNFAVLFLDLDHFKLVNDSLGHAAGDELLRTVARRLEQLQHLPGLSNATSVARLGGDEFTVLLDELPTPATGTLSIRDLLDRLQKQLSAPVTINGSELIITPSIGVAIAGPQYQDGPSLLRDADVALYRAKAAGRGRHLMFDAEMRTAAVDRLRMDTDLRLAMDRKELSLVYQPLTSLEDRSLLGFEALLRWTHDGQNFPPADFIPIAEENGCIIPIGAWVIEQACRQLKEWSAQHTEALTMNVNVSRKQINEHLAPFIHRVLDETGVHPSQLVIEITESALVDMKNVKPALQAVRNLGVHVHIDDFGTGYSSLSCLNDFPIDGLKIDRAFVMEQAGRRDKMAVLHAMVQMAHDLGMPVVAEGIETCDQVAMLQALNCDQGQGFYFARPMSAQMAGRMLNPSPARKSA